MFMKSIVTLVLTGLLLSACALKQNYYDPTREGSWVGYDLRNEAPYHVYKIVPPINGYRCCYYTNQWYY
jgi:hypothetical protein